MNTLVSLHHKFEILPPSMRKEALSYIDYLIEKSGKNPKKLQRKFGSAKGKIHLSKDFDEPLEDLFKDYM